MTYLNAKDGVANLFVKDVRECCAKLLKEPPSDTSGMVSVVSWPFLLRPCSGLVPMPVAPGVPGA